MKKEHKKSRDSIHNLFHTGDMVEFKFPTERARRGVVIEKRATHLVVRDPGPLKSRTETVRFDAVAHIRLVKKESDE